MTTDDIAPILAAIAKLGTAIDETQAAIAESRAETQAAIAELRAETKAGFAGHWAATKAAISDLRAETMAAIADLRAEMKAELAAVGLRFDAVEARLDRSEAWQTQIRVDLMDRMDRLQHEMRLMRDDVTANFAGNARNELMVRSASGEVRLLAEEVTAMRRQIHALQEDVRSLRGEA